MKCNPPDPRYARNIPRGEDGDDKSVCLLCGQTISRKQTERINGTIRIGRWLQILGRFTEEHDKP